MYVGMYVRRHVRMSVAMFVFVYTDSYLHALFSTDVVASQLMVFVEYSI